MTRRFLPFLMLAVVVANAPSAMAACWKCNPQNPPECIPVAFGRQGWTECATFGDEPCFYYGDICYGGQSSAPEPFSAEFTVAAVERLDEAQPSASETRAATIEVPRTTIER
ncbi:MAG TPA: hypothetical protein VF883_25020 [Thermoanaerobaculia bacterium]|jgi:hypothetical protein